MVEHDHLIYDSDYYGDDLPFWNHEYGRPHLVIPYTLDANDMRFASPQGFNSGDQFYQYLVDSFDTLYDEGELHPRMMSVGLHCRIAGKPGRTRALKRFLDYVTSKSGVWVCRRIDIAWHWQSFHAPL